MLKSLGRLLATIGMALVASLTCAVAQPEFGAVGKDVPWIPTSQALADKLLDAAEVTADDYVIDLGSGDGRWVISAAKRGAQALGIEFNPDLVAMSRRDAAAAGLSDRAAFVRADLFASDFSKATVITMFLGDDLNLRLRPKILALKPGTRVVSNTFHMGDWQPDRTIEVGGWCLKYCTGYLWVVPAKVEGTWRLAQGELTLRQKHQMISGTLKANDGTTPISGRLNGNQIAFTAAGNTFTGRVNGNTIQGIGGWASQWRATRRAR